MLPKTKKPSFFKSIQRKLKPSPGATATAGPTSTVGPITGPALQSSSSSTIGAGSLASSTNHSSVPVSTGAVSPNSTQSPQPVVQGQGSAAAPAAPSLQPSGKAVAAAIPSPSGLVTISSSSADDLILTSNTQQALETLKDELNSISAPAHFISILEKVEKFTNIFGGFAEIHPIAKAVVTVMSSTIKIFTQHEKDIKNLHDLLKIMEDIFKFVEDAQPLKVIESHRKTLCLMLEQTLECVTVIREYLKQSQNFMIQAVRTVISDISSQFQLYSVTFARLKRDFMDNTNLVTSITVLHMSAQLEALGAENVLDDMPYAKGASYQPEKGCLLGTRHDIIQEIIDWVFSPDGDTTARVFWLNGVAGSGKSSISHTIAGKMKDLDRLGSSFYFDRADQARRTPGNMFSTIARDLADFDLLWKQALYQVVKDDKSLRTTESIQQQFKQFILAPAKLCTPIGPVVIIIDALDESGDPSSREGLLQIFVTQAHNLPSNFRILITSRTEDDIHTSLSNSNFICSKPMHKIDIASTNSDIKAFVEHKLSKMAPKFNQKWDGNGWLSQLVEKANGSFQWAYAACQTILTDRSSGLIPTKRLERLLVSGAGLDGLYKEILDQAYKSASDDLIDAFVAVFGCILAAKEPLTSATLCQMHKADDLEFEDVVALIINPLGPLLSGATDPTIPLQPLHTSFRDFLEDHERAGKFFILTSSYEAAMAHSCFRIMKEPGTGLRFNIWNLETSYLPNDKVPETDFRKNVITPHLFYAVRFWAEHTQGGIEISGIISELQEFMENQFLHWLEVLSFRNNLSIAANAMHLLGDEPKIGEQDPRLKDWITDARQFLAAFMAPISQSTAHIYISGLSFSPSTSWIKTNFHYVSGLYIARANSDLFAGPRICRE